MVREKGAERILKIETERERTFPLGVRVAEDAPVCGDRAWCLVTVASRVLYKLLTYLLAYIYAYDIMNNWFTSQRAATVSIFFAFLWLCFK